MVIGMIGAFLFLLIQLVLIVDFAHAWNEKWVENYEESQSKWWYCGMCSLYFQLSIHKYKLLLIHRIIAFYMIMYQINLYHVSDHFLTTY